MYFVIELQDALQEEFKMDQPVSSAIPMPTRSLSGHSTPCHGTPWKNTSYTNASHTEDFLKDNLDPTGCKSADTSKYPADTFMDDPCFSPLPTTTSVGLNNTGTLPDCISSQRNEDQSQIDSMGTKSLVQNDSFDSNVTSQPSCSSSGFHSSSGCLNQAWCKNKNTIRSTISSGYFSSSERNISSEATSLNPQITIPPDYKHDAFLAYSHHDSLWAESLSDQLSEDPYHFRTYMYERDRVIGR